MTTKQLELIDYLMNNCFPNAMNHYFTKHQILNYKKIEIENYYFKYYIIEAEIYLKSYTEDIIDNAESYLNTLYSNKFSFETLIQDVISKKNKYKLLYPFLKRKCFIIRYSKKYNSVSCTETFESINFIKTSHNHNKSRPKKFFKATKSWNVNKFIFLKKENKLFNINKNNKVLMYFGINKTPRYISIKNANTFIRNNPIYKELIQKLFNIHLNNNMIIPGETTLFIKNKFLYNKNNFLDILKDINSNIVITTMIDKFSMENIVNVITMLKKEDMDKFIYFYNDYYDLFEILNKAAISEIVYLSENSLLNFLFFYILKSKSLIGHDNVNIYYSNLHKYFIIDVFYYIYQNFQKEITLDLSFNFHSELKYIRYKNNLKSILKLNNDTISFVSIFNKLNIYPQFQIVNINNESQLYKIIIKENIFIDLKTRADCIWFTSYFEDKLILFSLYKTDEVYSLDNLSVSNNQNINLENFKTKIINVLYKINFSIHTKNKKLSNIVLETNNLPF